MKRRTIDPSKLRRPVKRSRITDTVNGSWLLYLRFFIVWLLVITMDFVLEFRFEFLWPFWLLLRSLFDSFRYQGTGLTLLFLLITLSSDVICFLFLPVHWLFFVASTYVWVQFVCNTDRGPCIATISLWLVFVYVEASVRLREIKSVPFHLDLCRPFAAHCIGYPVVSLGYGFKSYVGYKVKHYKQAEVSKQNHFYHELVSYALPLDMPDDALNSKKSLTLTNGTAIKSDVETVFSSDNRRKGFKFNDIEERQTNNSLSLNDLEVAASVPVKELNKKNGICIDSSDTGFIKIPSSHKNYNSAKFTNGDSLNISNKRLFKSFNNSNVKKSVDTEDELDISDSEESTASSRISQDNSPKTTARNTKNENLAHIKLKDEQLSRRKSEQQVSQLESEVKRLRCEIHNARQNEVDTRTQMNAGLISERYLKAEVEQLKSDNENLQQKIVTLMAAKAQDKALITSLEKKLKNERDNRLNAETQLKESKKKSTKPDDNNSSLRVENHDSCIAKRLEIECDMSKLQDKLDDAKQSLKDLQKVNDGIKRKNSENEREKMKKDVELLTAALNAVQGKNLHLESSLSSETRLKLDLFSALGETRRQLEITQSQLNVKCSEVDVLKGKVAEVMAVMPPQYHSSLGGFVSSNDGSSFHKANGMDIVVTTAGYVPKVTIANGMK